jgi:hypothetical protein
MSKNPQRWKERWALAYTEQDPFKFLAVIEKITNLLEAKEKRLLEQSKPKVIDRLCQVCKDAEGPMGRTRLPALGSPLLE